MLARTAICLMLLFSAGTAFAEEGKKPQAASWQLQASLPQGVDPAGQENAMDRSVARPNVEDLIREGNKRMREGDILGARQSYQKAVASGDAAAALVMGRSYDPIYFERIAGRNAEPDPAQAFAWYRQAMGAGAVQTAMVRIEDLKGFLGK
jgi:TPR repeat protein